MKCKNCGIEFEEGIFCPECGTKIEMNLSDEEKEQMEKGIAERELLLAKQRTEQERMKKERELAEQERIFREREEQKRLEQERLAKEQSDRECAVQEKTKNEGLVMATLSLICGIIALATFGGYFVPQILGIVFAFLGKKQGKMRRTAKVGLICSIVSIIVLVLILMLA